MSSLKSSANGFSSMLVLVIQIVNKLLVTNVFPTKLSASCFAYFIKQINTTTSRETISTATAAAQNEMFDNRRIVAVRLRFILICYSEEIGV